MYLRIQHRIGRQRVHVLIGVFVLGLIPATHAYADDAKRFELTLIPYVWLPGIEGDIGAGPVTTSPDVCFTEIANEATCLFGVFGRVEGWYDRIGFYVDGGYTTIKFQDKNILGATIDVDTDLGVVDFGLLLKVAEWKSGDKDSRLELDAYVGGRYMYVGADFDLPILPNLSANEGWVDPVVGGRVVLELNRKWSLIASGDVGGFGAASDFTWEAMGYLAYRFPLGSKAEGALLVGYKAIGDDYETGSGLSRFEWDVTLHGPVVGMAFQF